MQIMTKNMKSVNLLFQVFPPEDCLQLMQTGQRLAFSAIKLIRFWTGPGTYPRSLISLLFYLIYWCNPPLLEYKK